MFRGWFSRQRRNEQTTSIDDLRNAAVAAWIKTFPEDSRLERFLEPMSPAVQADLRASARAIYECAGEFLEANVGIDRIDLESFNPALRSHLTKRFPWAKEPALRALQSYTNWYAWHEGY